MRVDAEWKYADTRREGSGRRDSGVASKPLMLSPRKEGISTPFMTSIGLDRGLDLLAIGFISSKVDEAHLANCPAMRAIRTTGIFAPTNNQSMVFNNT